ncbi:MAG: hypothetical protein IKK99_05080 [Oscillospiraceae bacterium]|nr:hypothetical protein [Oscillospiraceae bacterium]
MRLFITIEGQNCTEIGLSQILSDVRSQLSFLTNIELLSDNESKYGTEFKLIAIIPTCVDEECWNILGWKERKQIWRKKGEADIRLRMDYERFVKETPENKRLMFIDIIIKSIQAVQEHSKADFNGEVLISDILSELDVTMEQLDF